MLSIPEIIKRLEKSLESSRRISNRPTNNLGKSFYYTGRQNGLQEAIKMLKGEIE
jgi:hypothetical protein